MQTLLAPSPVEFAAAGRIRPISITDLSHRLGIPLTNPYYKSTSYGIRTHLPIIPYQPTSTLSLTTPTNVSVAVLACEHEDGSLVLLFLRHKVGMQDEHYVGDFVDVGDDEIFTRAYFRVAFLASSAPSISQLSEVREVYIHSRPHNAMRVHLPQRALAGSDAVERINYSFLFPEWVLSRLSGEGFVPQDRPASNSSGDGLTLEMPVLPGLDVSAIFRLTRVTSVTFKCTEDARENFTITIGIGCMCQLTQKRRGFEAFWVDVSHSSLSHAGRLQMRQKWTAALGASGGCTRRHLTLSPVEFAGTRGTVRLTITPWGSSSFGGPAGQECNYVVDVELVASNDEDGEAGSISPIQQSSSTAAATLRRAVEMLWSLRK
ncbi:hypothetical protein L227DRAFT_500163 [Lentinus tigrinus ALCF2SS1-6]|uniref:DUF8212 domain-containing protein n=3 Tax=Lentinus tigrinus TaxID=5365 RepID=A0A5C2SEW4_9APHY|nr:hypothetical protein L227DRAFT_500163 [Lentinus tigrinus ALCF2SS1-6]